MTLVVTMKTRRIVFRVVGLLLAALIAGLVCNALNPDGLPLRLGR